MLHTALLPDLHNLDLLLVGILVAATGVLGFVVFLNNRSSITNRSFFLFSIITIVYFIINYSAYQMNAPMSLKFFRVAIFFAVWHAFLIFHLIYVFPFEKIKFPVWYKLGLVPLVGLSSILNLTPFVFSRIGEVSPTGQLVKIVNGPGIILFGALVLAATMGATALLFKKTIKARGIEKIQFVYILIGTTITFLAIITFSFIFPALLDNPRFLPLSPIFFFPFIAFTSYAILKHKLFNIRVAGTAVLVFLLSIATFFEVILARDIALIIYRSSILLLVLVFGVLLIRGVLREVEQREEMERLSEKLEVANVRLDAAYKKVDKLSRAKSEFISIASHQLRTPLTAIKGYISMVLEGTYGRVAQKARLPMENVYQSNERLINLVNDLLSISRIEAGRMELVPEQAGIGELIDGVVQELKITAEKKKLFLKYAKPETPLPKLLLDKDKMRQVFLNLVNNAIKYTNQGEITIKSLITNDKLLIIIADTGEGMTKEDLGKVFQSFSRGTVGTKLSAEGAGLGLYIARKFVEMHRGAIWAESEGKGKGSTFFVELPLK